MTQYLDRNDFRQVIGRHAAWTQARLWRDMFARIADDLARFYVAQRFPGARALGANAERTLREMFASGPRNGGLPRASADPFRPWTGWWTGRWSDQSAQYHVWDETSSDCGGQIQLVSQSQHDFAHRDNWSRFASRDHHGSAGTAWVDLGLNAYDRTRGITGWVTKRDIDLPHIGYLQSERTLYWITWMNGSYFLFEETATDAAYSIFGQSFRYDAGGFRAEGGVHNGTYARHPAPPITPPRAPLRPGAPR
jgi:hypothetical protein